MAWEALAIMAFFALVLALMAGLWRLSKKEREQRRINRAIQERRWNDTQGTWIVAIALGASLLAPWPQTAQALSYDIVYVRAPRAGDTQLMRWPEVKDPIRLEPGTVLMLRRADGSEEILVDAGGDGAVIDPFPSFDAQHLYYVRCPNVRALNVQVGGIPIQGCDIFKMHLASQAETRLTNQEWTPNTGVGAWCATPNQATGTCNRPGYGVFNMAPTPLAGGRVMFTSSRQNYAPNIAFTNPNMRLHVLDEATGIVTNVGQFNLGSALHPFPLMDGTVAFSTMESAHRRDPRLWSLWRIYPDGRQFAPLWSSFLYPFAAHFATQLSDGRIASTIYYNQNRQGFGTLLAFTPLSAPQGRPVFGSPLAADPSNSLLDWGCHESTGTPQTLRFPFSPYDLYSLTPFATAADVATACKNTDGTRKGAVTHPSAAPGNTILLVWSPGPTKGALQPVADGGIYLMDAMQQVTDPATQLDLVVNNPAYNEQQPRALVPWSAIYGQQEPVQLPWLPRQDERLHPGEAAALFGSSSLCWHNADTEAPAITYRNQGSSIGKGRYGCADIWGLRVLLQSSLSAKHYGTGAYGANTSSWVQMPAGFAVERLRILGEMPVKHPDPASGGNLQTINPDGSTEDDTSFLVRLPCQQSIGFQTLDAEGKPLNHSSTWHTFPCGSSTTDCGGCHAHARLPKPFAGTAASLAGYPVPDFAHSLASSVEFARDVAPILARLGLSPTYAWAITRVQALNAHDSLLLQDAALATPQERQTLIRWIALGAPNDNGGYLLDDEKPGLHIALEGGVLYVGASDPTSGIDTASLAVTVDGVAVQMTPSIAETWMFSGFQGGRVRATVRDMQGNVAVLERQF